jgi:hypothetical protein
VDLVPTPRDIIGTASMTIAGLCRRTSWTLDEVETIGALLMGPDGAFIIGSDFLMDGHVTVAFWFGDLALK